MEMKRPERLDIRSRWRIKNNRNNIVLKMIFINKENCSIYFCFNFELGANHSYYHEISINHQPLGRMITLEALLGVLGYLGKNMN